MTQKTRSGTLIVMSMGLGDLFFALPSIRALKQEFPNEDLFLVTHENHKGVIDLIPELNEVIAYDSKDPLSLMDLCQYVSGLNLKRAYILNPIFRGSVLAFLAGIPERISYLNDYEKKQSLYGFHKILCTQTYSPRDEKMHETERYLDLLRMSGVNVDVEGLEVPSTLSVKTQAKAKPIIDGLNFSNRGPFILVNVGAAWENRRWPAIRIAQLASWLHEAYNARVLLLGGKAEQAFIKKITKRLRVPVSTMAGQTTLEELTSLIHACDLFITHDTGAMHIGSAFGKHMISLFGPGDLDKVRPRSENSQILFHKMPCHPCRFQYTTKCQNNLCMKEIMLPEVQDAVMRVLGPAKKSIASEELISSAQRKRKILYLQSTSEISGTDITLLRTIRELDPERYEPHVMLHKEGPFLKEYSKLGCQVFVLADMRKLTTRKGHLYFLKLIFGYIPAVIKIANYIRQHKIDLVHTNTIHNLYGFLAARIARVPHIWHIREIVVQSRWLRLIECQLVERFSDRFIVMGNAISEMFLSKNRGYPKKIAKIYDGVDLKKFSPEISGDRIKSQLHLPEGAKCVGLVCRLDPWKGPDRFLEAAARVAREVPNAYFWICGGEIEGHEGYENRLKDQAKSLGILDRVRFTGWQFKGDDGPEIYRALDVSVQTPAHPEPFGLVTVEAMASGIPIVAYDAGGSSELCENGKSAMLVKPHDTEATAQAIINLLNDDVLADRISKQARSRAEKVFDHHRCVKQIEALYESLLSSESADGGAQWG